jgi:hypothetical protein
MEEKCWIKLLKVDYLLVEVRSGTKFQVDVLPSYLLWKRTEVTSRAS